MRCVVASPSGTAISATNSSGAISSSDSQPGSTRRSVATSFSASQASRSGTGRRWLSLRRMASSLRGLSSRACRMNGRSDAGGGELRVHVLAPDLEVGLGHAERGQRDRAALAPLDVAVQALVALDDGLADQAEGDELAHLRR